MILSTGSAAWPGSTPLLLALAAVLAYALAALPAREGRAWSAPALVAGWVGHLLLLMLDIGGWGQTEPGARLGFAPVLSMTV